MSRIKQCLKTIWRVVTRVYMTIFYLWSMPVVIYIVCLIISAFSPQFHHAVNQAIQSIDTAMHLFLNRHFPDGRAFFESIKLPNSWFVVWGFLTLPLMLSIHIDEKRHPKPISLNDISGNSELEQKEYEEKCRKEAELNERLHNYYFHGVCGQNTGNAKYINGERCDEIQDWTGKKYYASETTTYEEE